LKFPSKRNQVDKEIRQELGHQAVALVTCLWTPQSTMTYTLLYESKWSLIRRWSPSWDGGKLTKGCLLEVDGGDESQRWAVSGFSVSFFSSICFLICLLLWLYMHLALAAVKCWCMWRPCL